MNNKGTTIEYFRFRICVGGAFCATGAGHQAMGAGHQAMGAGHGFQLEPSGIGATRSRFFHFVAADQPPAVRHSKILFSHPASGSQYYLDLKFVSKSTDRPPTIRLSKILLSCQNFVLKDFLPTFLGFGFNPFFCPKAFNTIKFIRGG